MAENIENKNDDNTADNNENNRDSTVNNSDETVHTNSTTSKDDGKPSYAPYRVGTALLEDAIRGWREYDVMSDTALFDSYWDAANILGGSLIAAARGARDRGAVELASAYDREHDAVMRVRGLVDADDRDAQIALKRAWSARRKALADNIDDFESLMSVADSIGLNEEPQSYEYTPGLIENGLGSSVGHHDDIASPTIVCLCGSTRHKDEFEAASRKLTLDGLIVIMPGVWGHAEDDARAAGATTPVPVTLRQKQALDVLHKRKIDLANSVVVIIPDGHIGESTQSEIAYARLHGKPVRYWTGDGELYWDADGERKGSLDDSEW